LKLGSAEKAGKRPAFLLDGSFSRVVNQMVQQEIIDRVSRLADSILSREGFELVEIQFRREARGWVLRLYVDREGGVTLEDCAQISHEIGRNLDVEDFILYPYILEVSSPGLTRPLKTQKDFMKYRDRLVKVTAIHPIENRRHFKGRLRGVEENRIRIEINGGEMVQIPLSEVARANLEIDPFEASRPRR
jgi:ribosome maturation factor RimP